MLNHLFMDDVPGLTEAAPPHPALTALQRRNRWIRVIGGVVAVVIVLVSVRRTSSPTALHGVRTSSENSRQSEKKTARGPAAYAWLSKREKAQYAPLVERIPTPDEFTRVPAPAGSLASWLRHLPVAPADTPVTTGKRKVVLAADAPQLAAAIRLQPHTDKALAGPNMLIRLRAEYCWSTQRLNGLGFHFTSGHVSEWNQWADGRRPVVQGKNVAFQPSAERDESRESYCSYLETIFQYSSVYSVFNDTQPVDDGSIAPGDVFLRPGKNVIALMVLDVATNEKRDVRVLLGDTGTPAQTFHVIKSRDETPWFPIVRSEDLTLDKNRTLRMKDLRRWR